MNRVILKPNETSVKSSDGPDSGDTNTNAVDDMIT